VALFPKQWIFLRLGALTPLNVFHLMIDNLSQEDFVWPSFFPVLRLVLQFSFDNTFGFAGNLLLI